MLSNLQRPSSLLLMFAGFFSLLTLAMAVLLVFSGKDLSRVTKELNQTGVIRGTAQRVVKLELMGASPEDVDRQIRTVSRSLTQSIRYVTNPEASQRIKTLYAVWEELVVDLRTYRERPGVELANDILLNSEQMWQMSDAMAKVAIDRNENRWDAFDIIFILLLINALSIVGLFLFSFKTIRGRLENEAITDSLCGIGSRRAFDIELERQWSLFDRYSDNFSVLLLDIDHFKNINDAFGHTKGDIVLKEMAQTLGLNTRSTDKLYRVGGEEFALIAPHTSKIAAAQMADTLRKCINEYHFTAVGRVSVSIGVAEAADVSNPEELYYEADKAMYFVKRHGRNGTHFSGEIDLNLNNSYAS